MRIERVQIDGFGCYRSLDVGPFDRALTVLVGPNEVGKTTLLAFLRRILFGFPDRRRRINHYEPLAGGRHGGRLVLCSAAGQQITVERYAGSGGSTMELVAGDGTHLAEEALRSLLGHAPEGLFSTVFAFDLDDLQHLGTGSDDSVSSRIYSAGIGAVHLPEVLRELTDRADAIFRTTARSNRVRGTLSSLQDVDRRLQQASDQAMDYARLQARHDEIDASLAALRQHERDANSTPDEAKRHRDAWDEWVALGLVEERLREIPTHPSFPQDGVRRLEDLDSRLQQAREAVRSAVSDVDRLEIVATTSVPDAGLLAHEDALERLRRDRGALDASIRDLPERQTEARSRADEVVRRIEALGPGWSAERVTELDTSVTRRDAVTRWRDRIADALQSLRDAEAALRRDEEALGNARAGEAAAERAVAESTAPPFDPTAVNTRRVAARQARQRVETLTRARQRRQDLAVQHAAVPVSTDAGWSRWLPAGLLAVLGIVGVAVGGARNDSAAFALGLAALAGAAVLATRTFWRRPPAVPRPMLELLQEAEKEEAVAESRLRESAAALGIDADGPLLDASEITALEDELERAVNVLSERATLQQTHDRAVGEREGQERAGHRSTEERDKAQAALQRMQDEWDRWLLEQELPPGVTPTSVLELLTRAEGLRAEQAEVRRMSQRVTAVEDDIRQFYNRLAPTAVAFRESHPSDPLQDCAAVARAADALLNRLDEARRARAERDQAATALDLARRGLSEKQDTLQQLESERTGLLAAGGATDAEAFRRAASEEQERRTLEREREGLLLRLAQRAGPGDALSALLEALATAAPASLNDAVQRAQNVVQTLDQQVGSLHEERGEVTTQLEQLQSDEETSSLRAEREVLRERLLTDAAEWTRLQIALALLKEARRHYEEQRQPTVIREAQDFFRHLTRGRYPRLYAPLGKTQSPWRILLAAAERRSI